MEINCIQFSLFEDLIVFKAYFKRFNIVHQSFYERASSASSQWPSIASKESF